MDITALIGYAHQQAARIHALAERLEMALRELKDLQDEAVKIQLENIDDRDNKAHTYNAGAGHDMGSM